MLPEDSKRILASIQHIVSHGVVPMLGEDLRRTDARVNADDLAEAVRQVQVEVGRFFERLDGPDALRIRLHSLPNQNEIRLRLRQHLLEARLRRMEETRQQAMAPSDVERSVPNTEELLRLLGLHFGLTQDEYEFVARLSGRSPGSAPAA